MRVAGGHLAARLNPHGGWEGNAATEGWRCTALVEHRHAMTGAFAT